MTPGVKLEYGGARKVRERNKIHYRLAHWPIWIFVFFIAPGPQTFRLFAYGWDYGMLFWLAGVIVVTALAGLFGQLPGVEPKPYIVRFTEDRPNPLYRRICYTFAWSELIAFTSLNLAGLIWAVSTGEWALRQIYDAAYLPIAAALWVFGALGKLPRVKFSTRGEGDERRYFYGMLWAVLCAQPVLGLLWIFMPRSPWTDRIELVVFVSALAGVGHMASKGLLPRTRRIVPGEYAVSD